MPWTVFKLSPTSLMSCNDAETHGRLMSLLLPGLKPSIPCIKLLSVIHTAPGTDKVLTELILFLNICKVKQQQQNTGIDLKSI